MALLDQLRDRVDIERYTDAVSSVGSPDGTWVPRLSAMPAQVLGANRADDGYAATFRVRRTGMIDLSNRLVWQGDVYKIASITYEAEDIRTMLVHCDPS